MKTSLNGTTRLIFSQVEESCFKRRLCWPPWSATDAKVFENMIYEGWFTHSLDPSMKLQVNLLVLIIRFRFIPRRSHKSENKTDFIKKRSSFQFFGENYSEFWTNLDEEGHVVWLLVVWRSTIRSFSVPRVSSARPVRLYLRLWMFQEHVYVPPQFVLWLCRGFLNFLKFFASSSALALSACSSSRFLL